MNLTLKKMTSEALSLPNEDRAKLAHVLIASLDQVEEDPKLIESAWDEEVARRVSEIESGKAKGRPAEHVIRDIRSKYE